MQTDADSEDLSRFTRAATVPARGFDYGRMAPAEVAKAKAAAEWVRGTYRALEATTLEAFAEIGERLLEARETVGHGRFMAWVKSECDGISHTTALRMMDVAKNIGLAQIPHVVNLSRTLVYEVAAESTPPAIRAEVMAKAVAGQPIYGGTVLSEIKMARLKAQTAKRRARGKVTVTPALERARAREEKRIAAAKIVREASRVLGGRAADLIISRLLPEDRETLRQTLAEAEDRYFAERGMEDGILAFLRDKAPRQRDSAIEGEGGA